jgi:hypothetical protein
MFTKFSIGVFVPVLAVLASLSPASERSRPLPGLHHYGPFDTRQQADEVARVPRQTGYRVTISQPRNQAKWFIEIFPVPAGNCPNYHVYGPYANLGEANRYAAVIHSKSSNRYHVKVFQEVRGHYHGQWFIQVFPWPKQPVRHN